MSHQQDPSWEIWRGVEGVELKDPEDEGGRQAGREGGKDDLFLIKDENMTLHFV